MCRYGAGCRNQGTPKCTRVHPPKRDDGADGGGTNINAFVDEARVELYSDAVRSLVPACVGVLTMRSPESLAVGPFSPCDYGGPDRERRYSESVRVCERAAALDWVAADRARADGVLQRAIGLAGDAPGLIEALEFRDMELLRYSPGSFFADHVDRDRGNNHLGTLLLIMPTSDCAGGGLVVEGRRLTPADNSHCVAFVPLGTKHSVEEISAGTRWVAKASVHVRVRAGSLSAFLLARAREAKDRSTRPRFAVGD